jgi:hypothetical protein
MSPTPHLPHRPDVMTIEGFTDRVVEITSESACSAA